MSLKKNIFEENGGAGGAAFNAMPSVTYTGHMKKEKDWNCPPHSHECAEILFCNAGKGNIWVEGKEYPLKKGDVAIFNPYVSNGSSDRDESGLEFFFLGITDFRYPPYQCNSLLPDECPVFSTGPYEKQLLFYFRELLQETSQKEMLYMPMVSALANLIVIQVLRSHQLNTLVEQKETEALSYSQSIKAYIDKNYNQPINLDTLSEASYISKSYISHQFKKHMGLSPIDYLIKKRMEIAKHLLSTTSFAVAEVSKQIGYDNPLYFSMVFKKNVGMSPTEYRRNYKWKEGLEILPYYMKKSEEDEQLQKEKDM